MRQAQGQATRPSPSARAGHACSPATSPPSRSRTSPELTNPSRNCKRSLSSSRSRRSRLPWRPHSQGCAARRPARHRQDADGQGHLRRSRRAVLLGLRLGVRGDVRRRGRQPGARPVRAGQAQLAVHHLHRRDRCGGSPAGPGWAARTTSAQTLNQILVEMDGFDTDTNIILVAATNRPDILDPALLRPGRFDRQVVMDRPDMKGREAILKVHVRGKPLEPGVDLETIARGRRASSVRTWRTWSTKARSWLAAQQARHRHGRAAGRSGKGHRGPERRSRLISEHEKHIVAYHEAGHALVMKMLPHSTRSTRSVSSAGAWRWATPCRCPKRTTCCTAAASSATSWPGCWAAPRGRRRGLRRHHDGRFE